MKMIEKTRQNQILFAHFLECHEKKGFPRWNFRKAERVTSLVSGTVALWQHSKFLQIWGLKCAKQLKYQHEWPWASFGATYRHQLVLQSSTFSLKIPCWSADNNLAHNPSDQDKSPVHQGRGILIGLFSRFNLLATSFTLLELVKLDLPFIIVLLPYIHFHSTGYWFLLLFDKTVHQPRKQLAIWPIRRRIWTFGGNSRVGIEAVLTFWTFWKICRLDPRGWAKLKFLQPLKRWLRSNSKIPSEINFLHC